MASPVGHAAVGVAVASVVAKVTGTSGSAALWIGAVIASGIPDLDVAFPLLGFSKRFHRHASHSLLVIAAQIALLFVLAPRIAPSLATGVLWAWSAALVFHPLLDVVATGPKLGKIGWGIPLLWPLSRRRFFVTRPVLGDPDDDLTVASTLREMRDESLRIVPACAVVVLLTSLWK
jgi:membrane-bound metal-dependent hydrolase YbcI (DUF457 family)